MNTTEVTAAFSEWLKQQQVDAPIIFVVSADDGNIGIVCGPDVESPLYDFMVIRAAGHLCQRRLDDIVDSHKETLYIFGNDKSNPH